MTDATRPGHGARAEVVSSPSRKDTTMVTRDRLFSLTPTDACDTCYLPTTGESWTEPPMFDREDLSEHQQ